MDASRMELECTMDFQDVIVLDNGSGYLKAGFAGEDAPRAVLPCCVATPLVDDSNREDEAPVPEVVQKISQCFYGDKALLQDNATLIRPIRRGQMDLSSASKDALESLWEHTFRNVLKAEEELPVLIADSMPLGQSSYESRKWMAEVLFEKLKVKSLAIFNTAVLSLFSTGLTRGLVVESGEGLTQAVPVFEGFAIPHAIFKMEVAGQEITSEVQRMMVKQLGADLAGNARNMQSLKEKVCCVALSAHHAARGVEEADEESRSFELPDGNIIQVPREVRLGATEVLWTQPQSMQKICMDAISTCDLDFRQDLVRSIVVAGGTSLLPGLSQRLRSEMVELLPDDLTRQVNVTADSQRRHAAWIGGSMFASLSTFDQVAITKQEYEEGRADLHSLVARKTF